MIWAAAKRRTLWEGENPMDFMLFVVLVVIAVILYGILTAVKDGFNQVIRGLESVDRAGKEPGAD
jgi:hypothetical protein